MTTRDRDAPGHRRGDLLSPDCPTRMLLDRIGTKWTALAIRALAVADPEEVRFAQLRREMPGVSQKMLSATLRRLRSDGLVTRRVVETVPPSVYYGLTDLGRSLEAPLAALREWAEEHMVEIEAANEAIAAEEAVIVR